MRTTEIAVEVNVNSEKFTFHHEAALLEAWLAVAAPPL